MTYLSGTNTKNGTFFAYEDWAYVTFEFRNKVPTDLIITVNENIEGSEAGSGGTESQSGGSVYQRHDGPGPALIRSAGAG